MRVRMKPIWFLVLLFWAIVMPRLAAQNPQAGPPRVIAIKAGKLVDPEKGTTAANQIILVRGRKIEAVGANVQIPADAHVIDLSNSTVLPGLFDAHTHLCMTLKKDRDAGSYYITTLLDPTPYRAIEGVANARDMLAAGFTTIRDVGNAGNYADTALREAIGRGLVPGPTIVNAGRIIAQYGATVIKIVVDDQKYIYTVDDIRFMVEEAHRAGFKIAAHCWTHAGAHNAAEAGVDSIEHGQMMTNDDLQLAKKNHVVLVGTDLTEIAAREAGSPALHQVFVDRLKRAYQIGVTMAFGTDVYFTVPGETRGTLSIAHVDSWAEAGVPAKDTLQAMTLNAARLLGVDGERGAIKPGLAADIIAMSENPLENIQAVRKVSFVMKDGNVFKGE